MKNSSNISKESKSEPCLPWEIIDEILVFRGDPLLAVDLDRFRTVMRIDSNALKLIGKSEKLWNPSFPF